MGKGGKSKSIVKTERGVETKGKRSKGGKSKGGKSKGGPREEPQVIVKTIIKYVTKGSKDKGKGKKGKGKKGKGGKFRAAPLQSKFWEQKVDEEDRKTVGSKTFSGTIQRYIMKFGWGLIAPDDPSSLPKNVKNALAKSKEEAEEKGKEVEDENLLYFRKPDVNHEEGFKLAEGVACTFQVYVDNKGAGAYEVSQA